MPSYLPNCPFDRIDVTWLRFFVKGVQWQIQVIRWEREGATLHFWIILWKNCRLFSSFVYPFPSFHNGWHFGEIIDFSNRNRQPDVRAKRERNFEKIGFFKYYNCIFLNFTFMFVSLSNWTKNDTNSKQKYIHVHSYHNDWTVFSKKKLFSFHSIFKNRKES